MTDYRYVMALQFQGRPYWQIETMATCSHRTIAKARRVRDDELLSAAGQRTWWPEPHAWVRVSKGAIR